MHYFFGKWAVAPYTPIEAYLKKCLFRENNLPKYAVVSFRPEKIHSNAEIICRFTEDLGYKPTHIRFGNDVKGEGYGTLILSNYIPNRFMHAGSPKDQILDKWSFLIPGLNESFIK